jgi:hypothetical protein
VNRKERRAWLSETRGTPISPDETCETLLAKAREICEQHFQETPVDLPPILIIDTANNERLLIAFPQLFSGDSDEKQATKRQMPAILRSLNAIRYASAAVCWLGDAASGCKPSENPNRKEAVVISVADGSGMTNKILLATLKRNGAEANIGEWEEFTNRMPSLFEMPAETWADIPRWN